MRHGKKVNHLSRKKGHRKALLANMATSLVLHKRIKTTVAKAKALRTYIEPVITRSKEDTTHNRRMAFRYLASKEGVKVLFDEVANKVADRPGGYTRIIRMGNRLGDNAEMAMIELVDYNELYTQSEEKSGKRKRRRTRRGSSSSGETASSQQPAEAKEQREEPSAAPAPPATEDTAEEVAETKTPAEEAPATGETQQETPEATQEEEESPKAAGEAPEEQKEQEKDADDAEEKKS